MPVKSTLNSLFVGVAERPDFVAWNPDPVVEKSEIDSILRRFQYFEAISKIPST